MSEVTKVLAALERCENHAGEELLPLVYDELRRLAARKLTLEKPGQTLQATALVHEAWLRLAESPGQAWNSRAHFFGAAAEAMRRILVENARRKQARKRGGAAGRLDVDRLEISAQYLTNACWPWTKHWTPSHSKIPRRRGW